MEKIVAKTGAHVIECAGNGREAVEMCDRGRYDLIFMDIQMPVMDGLEATRMIRSREHPGEGKVHICAMTANAMKEDMAVCLKSGMASYVAKPVQEEEVFAVVRQVAAATLPGPLSGEKAGNTAPPTSQGGGEGQTAADPTAVFDRNDLLLRLGGEEAHLRKLVAMFIDSANGHLAALGDSVARGDAAAIRMESHAIKGAAATIGAGAMRAISEKMEAAAKGGELSDVPRLYGALEKACRAFQDAADDMVREQP
jgi:CheY-like chemotaxis protein/HPt (histidine-containing phosphotransfer) domain-containing protein